jgi:predicted SnoaL-like aldol condensation-catalyzing enzyme
MTTEENKNIVQRALANLVGTGDVDALGSLLSDDFVHHRPDSTTRTKAEWLAAVRTALGPLSDMKVEIEHVLADGDHVVMHSRRRVPGAGAADPEVVVVDILRVEDGLIAEVWEIIEPVAQASANLAWWEPAAR